MDKNKLAQRLMATFLEEVHEHIVNMNRDLLALEKVTDADEREQLLKVLFRSAHSLKGASRVVNVDVIENACHKLEDLLDEIRSGKREFTGDLLSLFLRAADGIEEIGTRLRTEQDLSDASLHTVLPLLEAAIANQPGTSTSAADDTSAVEPPPAPSPSAAAPAPKLGGSPTPPHKLSHVGSVRVPAEKLDSLLAQSGELLIARGRVDRNTQDALELSDSVARLRDDWADLEEVMSQVIQSGGNNGEWKTSNHSHQALALLNRSQEQLRALTVQLDGFANKLSTDARHLTRTCRSLEKEVYQVRMLPFAEACAGLERIARDVAKASGKQVEFILEGQEVEVDRSVLEGLKAPLVHLVTNAIDHGIEIAADREASGKDGLARISVSASLRGDQVQVVVSDDGRGIDIDEIRSTAIRRGIPVPSKDEDVARLMFSPGFSTLSSVSEVSGRGVGLDVVQSQIESLHGSVDVAFSELGTRFTMKVPLTLTTIRCLLVRAGDQTIALPTLNVKKIVRFHPDDVKQVAGRDMLMKENPISLASLADLLTLPSEPPNGKTLVAVILTSGKQKAALMVDDLISEREILVKNLGSRVRRVRHVAGATLLSSGEVSLVLNAASLVRSALGTTHGIGPRIVTPAQQKKRKLLVVDDSMTTRTFMIQNLEYAGFEIQGAADGEEAWKLLTGDIDLVVSDVDMPLMDGIELTHKIRSSRVYHDLPVVLVTARSSDEDRSRGLEVGANAYIVKNEFDQNNLIKVIEQLL